MMSYLVSELVNLATNRSEQEIVGKLDRKPNLFLVFEGNRFNLVISVIQKRIVILSCMASLIPYADRTEHVLKEGKKQLFLKLVFCLCKPLQFMLHSFHGWSFGPVHVSVSVYVRANYSTREMTVLIALVLLS